jgi:hypothetical protein
LAYTETPLISVAAASQIKQNVVAAPALAAAGVTEIELRAKVTNPTGRLYLVVYIQDSPNGTDWYDFEQLQINTPGTHVLRTARKPADNVRVGFDFRNSTFANLDVLAITR